jgi:energy-coupling factor transporter ATP-binding protein EcfA2
MSEVKKSHLVSIMGAPSSGKSTLAASVHHQLKIAKKNSIFVGEAATDYIAEWGIPDTPTDQIVIFYKQLGRERMYLGSKEWIICDSSSLLNYFYFRSLFDSKLSLKDIATINHIQKEILKSLNQWHKIYYVPPFLEGDENDGIRYHNKEQILRLDGIIKNYLELERIPYVDLSKINISERDEWVVNDLIGIKG